MMMIIIIRVFWTQLGHDPLCPDLVLEMKLFFVAELHRFIAPELICLASNVCTLGDIIDVPTAAPRYHF